MEMKFWKNNELDDAAIIKALKQAVKDYEDGAIAEVRDSLTEIVVAIDEFRAKEKLLMLWKPIAAAS